MGIEENIFGCVQKSYRNEHTLFDGNYLKSAKVDTQDLCVKLTGLTNQEMHSVVRNHLMRSYDGWDEANLIYKKGK